MTSFPVRVSVVALVLVGFLIFLSHHSGGVSAATAIPAAAVDMPKAQAAGQETAVIAGGCFWGIQSVFQHVKGVVSATSGYAGGSPHTASYEIVSTGTTGHAEAVQITYDPSQVTYGQLLQIFFSVAHDPTELNRQGPDEGSQYRSAVFYANPDQKRVAEAYIAQLNAAKLYSSKVVTQVVPLKGFYPAEAHHQNYATINPNDPYIQFNDAPKVQNLKRQFPQIYHDDPTLVSFK